MSRAAYWLSGLCLTVGLFIIGLLIVLPLTRGASVPPLIVVGAVLILPMLVWSFSICIKRLHDRDKSGWWMLVFYLLPALLDGARQAMSMSPAAGLPLALASAGISLWAFVELGFIRGTDGYNRFGPDPLR